MTFVYLKTRFSCKCPFRDKSRSRSLRAFRVVVPLSIVITEKKKKILKRDRSVSLAAAVIEYARCGLARPTSGCESHAFHIRREALGERETHKMCNNMMDEGHNTFCVSNISHDSNNVTGSMTQSRCGSIVRKKVFFSLVVVLPKSRCGPRRARKRYIFVFSLDSNTLSLYCV